MTQLTIGQAIQKVRLDRGLKLSTVAKKSGIPLNSIANYEHDRTTPCLMNLITLADYYDISIDELIGRPGR